MGILELPLGDDSTDSLSPGTTIIESEHPLPYMIDGQVHTGFQFETFHRQSFGFDFILSCPVDGDSFQSVMIYNSTDNINLAKSGNKYLGSSSVSYSSASPVKYTKFCLLNAFNMWSSKIVIP